MPVTLPSFEDVRIGAKFTLGLSRLLRERISPTEAERAFRTRQNHREAAFLAMVQQTIYGHEISPYRQLLAHAGCEEGDVRRLVTQEGLEGALQALFRVGIYLTVAEAKGRAPVTRGSLSFTLDPTTLHDPRSSNDMVSQTNGSRGARVTVPISFDAQRDQAEDVVYDLGLRGKAGGTYAVWAVPGFSALTQIIRCALCGGPAERWFSMVDPVQAQLHPRYLWSARALRAAGWSAGVPIPRPEYVPASAPGPILAWLTGVLRAGSQPRLRSYVTPVVRLCQAAFDSGIDLSGTFFVIGGEPMTPTRRAIIERTGAELMVHYGATEGGNLARSCPFPDAADDMHVSTHRHAVIQPGEDTNSSLPPNALLMTSLLSRARLIMVNVSLGDQAELSQRDCGCPLYEAGLRTHIHSLRSFEKLTAGGMTFQAADVVKVLEMELPARFGGGPTDYQLVEDAGQVKLLVHPRLGPVVDADLRETFLQAMGTGAGVERVMAQVWRDANLPSIVREAARTTAGGKMQHVHFERTAGKTRKRELALAGAD